ncbi:MAG TPA: HAD-IA family hydrolase [Anaeromyxobacteraceae bacterium]|nr:HAD-IA family hydrolase [Anaeromyxobacteraceae bacterium]
MPRPIAVLLDLDGTLVDTVPFILASVRHAFEGYGRCPTDAEWIAGIGTPLRAQLAEFARDPADVDGLFARYRTYWLAEHDRMTRLFPGAAEAVRALRAAGHPIAIITAKIEQGAERTLRHVGLRDQVDLVVAADTVERSKPDPLPVRHALERLGRTAAEAVMIGDSNHDLAAGRAAGTATAGVLWGAASREVLAPLADHLLAEMGELVPLVARLQAGL